MPPIPNCTQTDITDSNDLPPDHHTTHTSQPNSSSVAHHRKSQPKSSAAPLPRVSKLLSSAAVHRTSRPKSSAAPLPHVNKLLSSATVHRKSQPKRSSAPTPHVRKPKRYTRGQHPNHGLPTAPPSIPPPNRPSLFPADDTIETSANPAPMLPFQVDIRFPSAPSADLPTNSP
jgi:hypothetical protein